MKKLLDLLLSPILVNLFQLFKIFKDEFFYQYSLVIYCHENFMMIFEY